MEALGEVLRSTQRQVVTDYTNIGNRRALPIEEIILPSYNPDYAIDVAPAGSMNMGISVVGSEPSQENKGFVSTGIDSAQEAVDKFMGVTEEPKAERTVSQIEASTYAQKLSDEDFMQYANNAASNRPLYSDEALRYLSLIHI